ncbi:MAG TPA: DUF418 domain-containing protein [Flavisolibacter sp.]
MATLHPLAAFERDVTLDILRGFALAGVLFIFCVSDIGSPSGHVNSLVDEIIAWPKYILVESRMYTMLILIFGIGFQVQLEKARRQGTSLAPAFSRRLAGLLVIGFIHAIVLSTRDILMFYGISGAVLLLIRKLTNRQLVVLMLLLLLLLVSPVLQTVFPNPWGRLRALVKPNGYGDYVQYNWQYFKLYHQGYYIYLEMLFYFLLGAYISRKGILQKLKSNRKLRRRLLLTTLIGTAIFIPVYYFLMPAVIGNSVIIMQSSWQKFLAMTGLRALWPVWMLMSVTLYSTILVSLSQKDNWKRRLRPLAAFGQMSLSNYLVQSLVLVPYLLLVDGFKNVPPAEGLILFLLVFPFQLYFSSWWLARYQLGPFEWLLRSITYRKWQPMKKNAPEMAEEQPVLTMATT